ncbi:MAG: hypothetical protein CMB80_22485 [Flammeovirgaceae bacterium]|nr:hypothetical protein [Flammeovirgaceae bacterium]MBE61429.1 hypothetical protein [Flammeovirgaceae bacterium]MBR09810.1 hypothetical protein [Rickettsiales bacterium]|tara:strand:- start:2165 stop:3304 length:1140 start_codon:yes stop_codon:yes gene_type:complete
MKQKYFLTACCLVLFISLSTAQLKSLPPSGANQKSEVKQYIGGVAWVKVSYGSPDVAGREGKIWGQLIPYGKANLGFGASTADNPSPWRAGANENTVLQTSHDMLVKGELLPAGRYGLFIEPMESGDWKVIFSSEADAWGSFFYEPGDEVLVVSSTPEDLNESIEYLTYDFVNRKNDQTTLQMKWEMKMLPINLVLKDANKVTLAALTSELKDAPGFTYVNWVGAANWASNAGFHEEALLWAENAISLPFIGQKNFNTLSTKATVLRNAGKEKESLAVMDEAIKLPGAPAFQVHAYGRQLIAAGEKGKALEVFLLNHKNNDGVWPTNYGLARGYSATGDYKKAIKYLEIALTKVPANDTVNPPVMQANIEKLKKGEDIN